MKTKKVLVVGGAGYIGGKTTDYLIRDGHDVTVYDNLVYENRYMKKVPFIKGDIRNTKKLVEVADNFDTIVLLGAIVGDPACNVDPALTEQINYKAIKNFCKAIDKSKHIIFMSTCSVYGAQDGILDENSKTNPLSSYAATKLAAEKHIKENNGTIFRLGTVFGLGDTYSRLRMDLVVNVLTMRALKYGEITINGGEQWRPIIAVKDIAEYIAEDVRKEYKDTFVLSKENVVIRQLGERVVKMIPETKINYTEISFQDARNYKVDNTKSLETFDYQPQVTVEEEVKRFVDLFEAHRIKDPEDIVYHNGQYMKTMDIGNIFKFVK